MIKILGVASGKGGVGKTTVAINLSAALRELGNNNIIIDADVSNANLSIQLGFQYIPVTLQDVLSGNIGILQAIRIHPTGLRVIPAALSLDSINVDITPLRKHLEQLNETIILDFPPGLKEDVTKLMEMTTEILVVTNPELTAVTEALKTVEIAKRMKKVVLGIVLNRVRKDKYELRAEEVEEICEVPVLVEIPEDKNVRKANFHHMPVIYFNPYAPSSFEYLKLASMLTGQRFTPPRFWKLRRIFRI